MVRILHVIGYLGLGGDTAVVLNVMNRMDQTKYKFDFLTHEGADLRKIQTLQARGSLVYVLPGDMRAMGPIRYYRAVKKTIRNAAVRYDVIHVHTSMQAGISMAAAKHAGIGVRVCHSHTNQVQRKASFIRYVTAVPLLRRLILHYATARVACSRSAGEFLYGSGRAFSVLYNGIRVSDFSSVSDKETHAFRASLHIADDDILVGHVASFRPMKNQAFTVGIAKKMYAEHPKIRFLFAGSGNDYDAVRKLASADDCNVVFLGQQNDIRVFMKALDCLVLPSLEGEGFPVVGVEAQAAGARCLISDKVTDEIDMGLGLVNILPLNERAWIDALSHVKRNDDTAQRNRAAEVIIQKGLDLEAFGRRWLKLYASKGEDSVE